MTIGLTIIVSERYKELDKCLESAAGFYDHLSVCLVNFQAVSTEQSRKVAMKYGAIISDYHVRDGWRYPFIDDFSTPRNMAIDALPPDADRIFLLDSDDTLTNPMEAREMILNLEIPFIVSIKLTDAHKTTSLYQLRGWSRGTGIYVGRIHEQYVFDIDAISNTILGINVMHAPTKEKKHRDRNSIILQDVIENDEPTARDKFHYAEVLYMRSIDHKKGWKILETQAIELMEEIIGSPELGVGSYKLHCYLADYFIMEAQREASSFKPAIEHLFKAMTISLFYPEPYFLMGKILYLSGKSGFAVGWLKTAMEMPTTISVWHSINNFRKALPIEQLAHVYRDIGDTRRAFKLHSLARALDRDLEAHDDYFGLKPVHPDKLKKKN